MKVRLEGVGSWAAMKLRLEGVAGRLTETSGGGLVEARGSWGRGGEEGSVSSF